MRHFILPYRQGSRSARALAEALGGRVLRLNGSTVRFRAGDMVINWGRTEDHAVAVGYNDPSTVRNASNKRTFFQKMTENGLDEIIPSYWTAAAAIPDDAFPVVCRTVLAGHSGDGIVIAANRDSLVPAPLYVRYVKKQDEYRIHVGRRLEAPVVISTQRKARRLDIPDSQVKWQVRNHANGFIYARQGVVPPKCVIDVAKSALMATGLDFGAVDVIYNREKASAYVLECNTAPGLEGQTAIDYAAFFRG